MNTRCVLAVLATLGLAAPVQAVDGVIEINQARAEAGGIAPGDTAGFPVTLDTAGSYRLTSDLSPSSNVRAVVITAADVTLDLNGFTIRAAAGNGTNGIDGTGNEARIVNGRVIGFGGVGVRADGARSMIEHVQVHDTGNTCIAVGHAAIVRHVTVATCGDDGVSVGDLGLVEDTSTTGCTGDGLSLGSGGSAIHVTASDNGTHGIDAGNYAVIRDSTAINNGQDGMHVGIGATVVHNTIADNGNHGICGSGGSTVIGNSVRDNATSGIFLVGNAGYGQNVIVSAEGGSTVLAGTEIGTNLCDGSTTCP